MLWKKCVKNKKNRIILLFVLLLSVTAVLGSRQEADVSSPQTSSIRREKEIGVLTQKEWEEASVAVAVRNKQTVSGNTIETVSGNTTGANMTPEAAAVFSKLNKERKAIGLEELVWNDELAEAAAVRAKEITVSFSHTRPDNRAWWSVNEKIVYGENLAKGYQSADDVMKAWLASAEHKDNILYPSFHSVGVAVYKVDGQWYWVQEFGY